MQKWSYSPALDQLRFFAATLVLFHHFRPWQQIPDGASGLHYIGDLWLQNGGSGVSLFIVLTGFLFSIIFDAGRLPVDYAKFLKKRALRIVPMYALAMLLLMTQIRGQWTVDNFLTFALFQVNTGNQMTGFGHEFLPIGPVWTIGVEFQFYLIFPLLISAVPAYDFKKIAGIVAIIIILRLALSEWTLGAAAYYSTYHTLLGRLDQFLIGMVAAAIFIRFRDNFPLWLALAFIVVSIVCLTVWHAVFDPSKVAFGVTAFTIEALLFAILIVGTHACGGVPGLAGKVLAQLGAASYSQYILHLFVGSVMIRAAPILLPGIQANTLFGTLIFVFIPTLSLSCLTYACIEKPFMDFGKRLGPNAETQARITKAP